MRETVIVKLRQASRSSAPTAAPSRSGALVTVTVTVTITVTITGPPHLLIPSPTGCARSARTWHALALGPDELPDTMHPSLTMPDGR